MRATAIAAILVSGSGCDAVLDLEEVAPTVIGDVRLLYATNDASFTPIVEEFRYPPGGIGLAVTLADGSRPSVDYHESGRFSLRAPPGQRYRLVVSGEEETIEYQSDAAYFELANFVAGRPDHEPIGATSVRFEYPDKDTATSEAVLASVGQWSFTQTGKTGPSVLFDWRLATPAGGSTLGLLDASRFDRLYALELTTSPIDGGTYRFIRAVSSADVTQVPGRVADVPLPVPVAPNRCARFVAPNATERDRIIAAAPRDYRLSGTDAEWFVHAVPAPDQLGTSGALELASSRQAPAVDLDLAPVFHDPYPGHRLVIDISSRAAFDLAVAGATPRVFTNTTRSQFIAEPGDPAACAPPRAGAGEVVALPGRFALDGTQLDVDDQPIVLDLERDPTLTWSIASDGVTDYYQILVQKLEAVNGMTTPTLLRVIRTTDTTAVLDRVLFEPGATYLVSVGSVRSRPNAAAGDWATYQLPLLVSRVFAHTFVVQ